MTASVAGRYSAAGSSRHGNSGYRDIDVIFCVGGIFTGCRERQIGRVTDKGRNRVRPDAVRCGCCEGMEVAVTGGAEFTHRAVRRPDAADPVTAVGGTAQFNGRTSAKVLVMVGGTFCILPVRVFVALNAEQEAVAVARVRIVDCGVQAAAEIVMMRALYAPSQLPVAVAAVLPCAGEVISIDRSAIIVTGLYNSPGRGVQGVVDSCQARDIMAL